MGGALKISKARGLHQRYTRALMSSAQSLPPFVPGGDWIAQWTIFLPTLVLSIPASTRMERTHGKDPHCVVIDEVVGMQIVLLSATPTMAGLVAAFALFRIFDVWKPFPIDRLQSLPGGWGIVVDDMLAGLYARAALMLAGLVTHAFGRFPLL